MHINAFESIYVTGLGGPEVEDYYFHHLFIICHGELVFGKVMYSLIHSFSHCRHTLKIIFIVFPWTCSASAAPTTFFIFNIPLHFSRLSCVGTVFKSLPPHPSRLIYLYLFMWLCVAVGECMGAPQAGLPGACELPEGGAGT